MLGTVLLHVLAHALIEQLSVFGKIHVDEVHHNDSSHITESQLSGQFIGSAEVYIESIRFLTFLTSTVAAVYIYHMQGFGMLDDEIRTMLVVDNSSKTSLDLLGDAEVVEDRHLTGVELDYARLFRGY